MDRPVNTFPILRLDEITLCMEELGISFTQDQLLKVCLFCFVFQQPNNNEKN